jgi:uncharacterized protein YkwD
MKSSLFLVAASALLASAGPMRKRAMVTDWVTQVVTVTVTEGLPAPTPAVFVETKKIIHTPRPSPVTTIKAKPNTSSTPPPPPPAPKPTPPTTVVVQPKPTSTSVAPVNTPAPAPPASKLGDYASTMVQSHNTCRAKHSAPAVEWDAELAQYALNTANTCVFAHDM